MNIKDVLAKVDHTLLAPEATWEQIKALCDDGIKFETASVCIPATFVKQAADYCGGRVKICTVIGFPLGYDTTASKCFQAADAVKNGADEIDMVINIGWLKEAKYSDVLDEINAVKSACEGRTLKVIIETCLLTDEEIINMSKLIAESDADFIKTSTGFSKQGATKEAVALMVKHIGSKKVKAAGGIASLEDAEEFLNLGAHRLGTSRIVKIAKELILEENRDGKTLSNPAY